MSRKSGRRLANIEDYIDATIQVPKKYTKKRAKEDELQETLITITIVITSRQTVNQENLDNKNWKKNNCMNISSNKIKKLYTKWREYGWEKKNLARETESPKIEAQNKAVKTNHIQSKIDNRQKNSKYRLYVVRDEMVNHIVRKSSKLAQMKFETRHDCIVIFWHSTQHKKAIPRWYTGRKWHIPMASNRKRSRGRIKSYDMGQSEGPIVPLQWCTGRE